MRILLFAALLAAFPRAVPGEGCAAPGAPGAAAPFVNSLGMRFVPVPGMEALFSIGETRVKDFRAFAQDREDNGGWDYRRGEDLYDRAAPGIRVLRGGSWSRFGARTLLTSYRLAAKEQLRSDGNGFRCVLAKTR